MDNFKTAIILAGGKSSRMGFDKQLLFINEKRLIYSIACNLEKHFEDIIIISNKIELYKDSKYKIISDEIKNMGPLSGISVGLNTSMSKYVYIVACDMPYIDYKYIEYMKSKIDKDIKQCIAYDMYISKIDGRIELFHGFYKRDLGKEIKEYLLNSDRKSIISFFERTNKKVKFIKDDEFNKYKFKKDMFINLNTKEDLNLLKRDVEIYGESKKV